MNSEFHQLPEKINRLADLAQALRHENAELRLSRAALASENADLSRRIQDACQRVAALLEKIPAAEQDEDVA
jgi:cell division protein ZapB